MELISTHLVKQGDVGYHGNLFGGIMLAWLDEAAASFACQVADTPRMVTKKIDEVIFHCPVRPGQLIRIYGQVVNIGTTSVDLKLEARRHSVYNGTQRVACSTTMKFVRIDGDGDAIPISDRVRFKYGFKPLEESRYVVKNEDASL